MGPPPRRHAGSRATASPPLPGARPPRAPARFRGRRIEIAEALRELDRPPSGAAAERRLWRADLPWGIALLAVASSSATLLARRPPSAPSRVSHLRLNLQPKPLVMAGSALSPDGRLFAGGHACCPGDAPVLVTVASPAGGPQDESSIAAQQLDPGERTVVVRGGSQATYSPTGHLVFERGNALFAVSFDPGTLRGRGTPFPVVEHVSRDTVRGGRYALAGDGTLVFFRQTDDDRPMLWVDRQGRAVRIPTPPHTFLDPRVSPDGTRIAVQGADGDNDIWTFDLGRGSLTRLTFDPGEDETPVWSPDGAWVAWVTQRSGRPRQVMRRRADGSGAEQAVWTTDRHAHLYDWSPDGKQLLVTQDCESTSRDVWIVPIAGGGAHPLLQGPFEERNPRLSPDGRWLAYSSDESGRFEVYVVRFPGMDRRAQVSVGGGDCAVWGARGSEIVYRSAGGEVVSVPFSPGAAGPRVGRPVELFPDTYGVASGRTSHVDYDVDPGGTRFVVVGRQLGDGAVELGVVLNWFDELRRLAAQGR